MKEMKLFSFRNHFKLCPLLIDQQNNDFYTCVLYIGQTNSGLVLQIYDELQALINRCPVGFTCAKTTIGNSVEGNPIERLYVSSAK